MALYLLQTFSGWDSRSAAASVLPVEFGLKLLGAIATVTS